MKTDSKKEKHLEDTNQATIWPLANIHNMALWALISTTTLGHIVARILPTLVLCV